FMMVAREQLRAQVLFHMGVTARVEKAAREGLRELKIMDAESPDHANIVSAMALTRSLITPEEAEIAIAEARRALTLYPATQDPWIRSWRVADLAVVLVRAGRHEEAVEQLEALLAQDTNAISVEWAKVDPAWDPLRGRGDFGALVGE
ncbi:hypothetical protein DRQ32_10345, partial [bacterium]